MRRTCTALVAAFVFVAAAGHAQTASVARREFVDTAAIAKIRAEGLDHSQVMDTAFWLTDRYGPRLTGSPEFEEAGDWAVGRLQSWGVQNVHKERFDTGRGWSLKNFHATMVAPRVMPIIGVPLAWTPGTGGTITADVVRPVIETEADLAKYRGKLKGKVVLTEPERQVRMLDQGDGLVIRYDDQNGKWRQEAMTPPVPATAPSALPPVPPLPSFNVNDFYRQEGVAALLDRGPDGDLQSAGSNLSWMQQRVDGGTIVAMDGASPRADPSIVLPQVTIAVEQYNRMARLLDRDIPVQIELDVDVAWTDASEPRSFNIIGDLGGTDKADEVVLIGAHFDSWQGGTGATDNAAGSAAMMEALRILRATGLQPRRTIRIGLWGDEEGGLIGSATYVRTHLGTRASPTAEGRKTIAYLNLDNGTGRIRGVWMQGNAAVAPVFEAWAAPLSDLGVDLLSPRSVGATDHVSFDAAGIPSFEFLQERYEYNSRTHHTNMDVFDRLQPDDLEQMATVAAVFAWQAATRDEPLPSTPGSGR